METASTVINSAFAEIFVEANEQPLETVDFQIGIRYLNRMMNAWAANGLNLGYTNVFKASDPITVPDGAIEGVVFNLAERLANQYDQPVTAELATNANDGLKSIRRIAVKRRSASFPCTLPIGSGNEKDQTYNDYHFYSCPDDEVLTEKEGVILLESQTNAE